MVEKDRASKYTQQNISCLVNCIIEWLGSGTTEGEALGKGNSLNFVSTHLTNKLLKGGPAKMFMKGGRGNYNICPAVKLFITISVQL